MTITANQAAAELRLSLSTIYRRCRAGILAAIKTAGRWIITLEKPVTDTPQYTIQHEPIQNMWLVLDADGKRASTWFTEARAEQARTALLDPAKSAPRLHRTPGATWTGNTQTWGNS